MTENPLPRSLALTAMRVWAVVLLGLTMSCKGNPPDPLPKADAAIAQLGTALKAKLTEAMKSGGPVHAIDVCAKEAPALYEQVKKDTGVTVGRASLRLRNPADAPPPWVAEWLAARGERKAEGVEPYRFKDGNVGRVIKPIAIEAACLPCHGAEVAPEVKAALDAKYPKDAATGYQVGDLRGAFWAEVK